MIQGNVLNNSWETEVPVRQGPRDLVLRITALLGVAVVVGIAANALSPAGIAFAGREAFSVEAEATEAGMTLVDVEEAQRIVEASTYIVLDARSADAFDAGHLPGALSMPVDEAGERFAELQMLLAPGQPVLVYCGGPPCDQSLRLGRFLREQRIEEVVVFEAGIDAWKEAGFPIETGHW